MTYSVWLLCDDDLPIGFAALAPAALGNSGRNKVFDRKKWSGYEVNKSFCNLSRLVLDPRYRGAGLAAEFLAEVAYRSPTRYVELITAMGKVSHFWEKAGFQDYGPIIKPRRPTKGQGVNFGRDKQRPGEASKAARVQSLTATMNYYLLDKKKVFDYI